MVGRADVWRMRMDATTNWSIGATAAVLSFALGNVATPHYVVALAPIMTACFLLLEARRLTFHRLWQDRVLQLERALVRPAIAGTPPDADVLTSLAPQLGSSIPTMPLYRAVARRMRRVYGFLFAVQLVAWGLKLANHPAQVESPSDFVARAHVGIASGEVVIGVAIAALLAIVAFASAAGGPRRKRTSSGGGDDGQ